MGLPVWWFGVLAKEGEESGRKACSARASPGEERDPNPMEGDGEVAYYDNDFDWSDHAAEMASVALPEVVATRQGYRPVEGPASHAEPWEQLFAKHVRGALYKPRNYLFCEFRSFLVGARSILEIGCGYGSSLFALIDKVPFSHYCATDCSEMALSILRQHKAFDEARVSTKQWDFCQPWDRSLSPVAPDVVLAVFALSAAPSSEHVQLIRNVKKALQENPAGGGYFLFRDYGLHDMTMYRHKARVGERTFQRVDETLCHYFTVEELEKLLTDQGFTVVELRYATVVNANRKENKLMRRVFVHGVFAI